MGKKHIDLTINEELQLLIMQERITNPGFNLSSEVELFLHARFSSEYDNKQKKDIQEELNKLSNKKKEIITKQSILMSKLRDIENKEQKAEKEMLEKSIQMSKSLKASNILEQVHDNL